jgi:hypothetical protein
MVAADEASPPPAATVTRGPVGVVVVLSALLGVVLSVKNKSLSVCPALAIPLWRLFNVTVTVVPLITMVAEASTESDAASWAPDTVL